MKEHLSVRKNRLGEQGLFANKDFKHEETVLKLEGEVTTKPTKHSIEVGDNEHITDEMGSYLNHSCAPNTQIDRENREVKAVRAVSAGEELSFDYNSNETEMATPFECRCGAPNCQKYIAGKKRKHE